MRFIIFLFLILGSPSNSEVVWTIEKTTEISDDADASEKFKQNRASVTSEEPSDAKSVLSPTYEEKHRNLELTSIGKTELIEDLNHDSTSLIILAENTPEVLEAKSAIDLNEWEIAKLESNLGPKVSIATSGGYKITSNLPRTHRRFSDDDSFLDASVKLSKRLFDSGFTKQQVSAETLRQKANVLRYKLSVNQALFEALSIGYNVLNLKQGIKKLDVALDKLKEYRLIEEKRFLSGTGISSNIKELDLLAIDLINEKQLNQFQLNLEIQKFQDKFRDDIEKYLITMERMTFVSSLSPENMEMKNLDSVYVFDIEALALERDLLATKRSNFPKFDIDVTTDFYDFQKDGTRNYEINGGLNVSIPIFDSGMVKSQINSISVQKKIVLNQRQKTLQRLESKNEDISKKREDVLQQLQTIQLKMENLQEKIEQLKMQSTNIKSSSLQIAQTDMRNLSLERQLGEMFWKEKLLNLDHALLFEYIKPQSTENPE